MKRWYDVETELLHRVGDLPAVDGTSLSEYYIQGKLHRQNGPAVIFPNGTRFWYWNNDQIEVNSQEEFEGIIKYRAFL